MNANTYELLAIFTSLIIIICSISLFIKVKNGNILFKIFSIILFLSGSFSVLMRSFRYKNNKSGIFCNHPLFYADVFFAFLSLFLALISNLSILIKFLIILAFEFMILGAIIPLYNLKITACYFHLIGHLIICLILIVQLPLTP